MTMLWQDIQIGRVYERSDGTLRYVEAIVPNGGDDGQRPRILAKTFHPESVGLPSSAPYGVSGADAKVFADLTTREVPMAEVDDRGQNHFLAVICPECDGNGATEVFTTANMRGQMTPCSTCGATGRITVEHMNRITKGKSMRDNRVSRLVSQREEAAALGIHPRALNDMERGREPGNYQ